MSSCSGIGLSSSTSIFSGGLCSGNSRRPSMFTAKYRLREERKKVLKVSLNKVRRIEDPENFLRRSVLINNTVKRLQREVREEKMVRNGGYMSKLSSMHSFRKSFASSRLQELVHADDLIDDSQSLYVHSLSPYSTNQSSRKRPLTPEPDSDVEQVLSQIYVPPTPRIISAIEDDDSTVASLESLSAGEPKKARMTSDPVPPTGLTVDDFEIDVDVVDTTEPRTPWNPTSDEVMDEFRLDFHLTSPNPSPGQTEDSSRVDDNDSGKVCEEKENTCEPVPPSSLISSCCSVPLADLPVHQHKCPNPIGNNSISMGCPPENTEKQFSSCGHSSIFGELQSVVFHSLIASLET